MNLQDVMKNLEESARLHRAYSAFFDVVVVSESHDETFRQVINYQLIKFIRLFMIEYFDRSWRPGSSSTPTTSGYPPAGSTRKGVAMYDVSLTPS